MDEGLETFPHFATKAIHAGQDPEQWNSMALIPPISVATYFKHASPGKHAGYYYSRSGNPTRACAEACVTALEQGKHGILFSSGTAAISALAQLLSAGDHIVASRGLCGGTEVYFREVAARCDVETTFVDASSPDKVKMALKPSTRMVWLETPSDPLMTLVDIEKVCEVAHAPSSHGDNHVFVVVDNTFMSPYFQRPLDLGADVVLHSASKYLNGHGDVIMGAVVTRNDVIAEKLRFLQKACGGVPSPFDCYMMNRGVKTLHVRMKEHMKNGLTVAKFLQSNPRVRKVIHPGLDSHPQHELATRQMTGYSGMVAFYIGGGIGAARTFLKSLKIFQLSVGLGSCYSQAEHPVTMTQSSISQEEKQDLGIHDNFVKLSVGIEDVEDLLEDLDQALKAAVLSTGDDSEGVL